MIPSQDAIVQVADRIERAYCRKHPDFSPIGLTPGVWAAAASRLFEAGEADRDMPVDPEMFVAIQQGARLRLDPWMELTQPRARKNYVKAVRRVVARLRGELRTEIRLGELLAIRGESLDRIVMAAESRISPLSRYMLAHRAGRLDLAMLARSAARKQDRSCPLYRLAARPFLPPHLYPSRVELASRDADSNRSIAFSLN